MILLVLMLDHFVGQGIQVLPKISMIYLFPLEHGINSSILRRRSFPANCDLCFENICHHLCINVEIKQPQNAEVIAWNPDGNSFVIKDVIKLTRSVLPLHFRHHKYESFIRQLNMYNFSKVKSNQGPSFANPQFKRGRQDLLRFIKRKPEKKKRKNQYSQLPSEHYIKDATIKMITEDSFPQKTKDQIEEQLSPPLLLLKIEAIEISTIATNEKKIGSSEDPRQGDQNLSIDIEPSCKWLNSKEESCWQNVKSFGSFRNSMKLLFEDEHELQTDGLIGVKSKLPEIYIPGHQQPRLS